MKLRKIVISVLLLVFGLCIAMDNDMGLVYATANDEFKFEQASYQYVLYDEYDSYRLDIEGVESCVSSDPDIAEVDCVYSDRVWIKVYSAGTVTLTATDASGNQTTCTIMVTCPEFKFEQPSYHYILRDDYEIATINTTGWVDTCISSNSDIVEVRSDYYGEVYITIYSAGTVTLTATDERGRQTTCTITVTYPEFKFEQSVYNIDIVEEYQKYSVSTYYYIYLTGCEPVSWECSGLEDLGFSVTTASYDSGKHQVKFLPSKVGSYKITMKDKHGRIAECVVNITISPLTVSNNNFELVKDISDAVSSYSNKNLWREIEEQSYGEFEIFGKASSYNYVMNVGDDTIVRANYYHGGDGDKVSLVGLKKGSTTVTITDTQYSRSIVINVTVRDYTTTTNIDSQSDAYYNKNRVIIGGVGVDGCRYEIYRSTSKNGKYKKVKTTKSTEFIDKKVKPDKKYYYKVKVQLEQGAEWGAFSKPVAYWTAPKTLGKKYVEKDVDNKQTITWKKVKGADGYYIHEHWLEFRGYNIFGKRLYYSYDKTLGTKKRKYTIKHSDYYTGEVTVIPYAKHNGIYYVHGENLMTSLKSYEMHK